MEKVNESLKKKSFLRPRCEIAVKNDTLATIQKTMRELFHTPDNVQTRLWTKYTERTFELLNNLETTVQDSSLFHNQLIIIDKQKSEGSWERQEKFLKD